MSTAALAQLRLDAAYRRLAEAQAHHENATRKQRETQAYVNLRDPELMATTLAMGEAQVELEAALRAWWSAQPKATLSKNHHPGSG